jgi:CheY-like chemotaxis protein
MNLGSHHRPLKRVLLVEDERLVRDTASLVLNDLGCRVVQANNGAEALGLFARSRSDLVMTDYELPFVKGNELAASVRRLVPQQRILMITGFDHHVGVDNPVDAVVPKPLDFFRLRQITEEILSQLDEAGPPDLLN